MFQLASGHYVCPTCQTSMIDMKKLWDYLDTQAQNIPVPKSHENSIVNIFCNDCFKVITRFGTSIHSTKFYQFFFSFFFLAINSQISFYRFEMCLLWRIQYNKKHQNQKLQFFEFKRYCKFNTMKYRMKIIN